MSKPSSPDEPNLDNIHPKKRVRKDNPFMSVTNEPSDEPKPLTKNYDEGKYSGVSGTGPTTPQPTVDTLEQILDRAKTLKTRDGTLKTIEYVTTIEQDVAAIKTWNAAQLREAELKVKIDFANDMLEMSKWNKQARDDELHKIIRQSKAGRTRMETYLEKEG